MKAIIDVSSVIYGGHKGLDRRIKGFPIGGIRKLFGIINAGLSSSDFVLCFDGGSIIKKELLPTYKAGRIPDYSVFAQIDLCKEMLLDCGIPFFCDEKYEADDFVFSICNMLEVINDTEKCIIYSDDRDLSCCVTDVTSIQNVTTNGICINRASYEDRVVRGRKIPYNTILLWKVLHGDSSDNYKALHIPGITFEGLAHAYVETLNPLIRPGGFTSTAFADFDVISAFLNDYSGVDPKDMDKLRAQIRIAFPMKIPVFDIGLEEVIKLYSTGKPFYDIEREHMKFFGQGSFNRKRFDFYCSLLGLNKTRPSLSVDKDSAEAQEFYSTLDLRAKELSSGAMAVARYRNKQHSKPERPTLENMELPDV